MKFKVLAYRTQAVSIEVEAATHLGAEAAADKVEAKDWDEDGSVHIEEYEIEEA